MAAVIEYSSPFVPPEWIAAHGLVPHRLIVDTADVDAAQGVCPFANDFALSCLKADACGIIVASTCDQMRRTAERVAAQVPTPVFLLNVPATWRTETSRQLYRSELIRLGRFLVACGGKEPRFEQMLTALREFNERRQVLRAAWPGMTARQYAEAICTCGCSATDSSSQATLGSLASMRSDAVRLALVGSPLRRADSWIYDFLEQQGARVVLDATEMAERGLAAAFDEDRLQNDPIGELVRAYFDTIPDAFRRPDSLLHEYLQQHLSERNAQGVVLVRYAWCDHWHAQRNRIKEHLSMPVVEVDLGGRDEQLQRTRTRLETLVSILR